MVCLDFLGGDRKGLDEVSSPNYVIEVRVTTGGDMLVWMFIRRCVMV